MNRQFFTLVFALLVAACHAEAAVLLTSENQLLEPGTYEVASNVKLTRNLTFKEGTTLIFNGGKLVADKEVTITGKSTAIEAPDAVIFSSNIKADGMWRIPYASPLWWEPVITSATLDYAPGINKAAVMVCKGVVQLPRGQYFIGEPLFLPVGVTLRGASGNSSWDDKKEKEYGGTTRIKPIKDSTKWIRTAAGTGSKFFIYANSSDSCVIKYGYPTQWNVLENLRVTNDGNLKFLRGVFVAGGAGFDGVVWENFSQAVCYSHNYNDNKKLVNCQFNCDYVTEWPDDKDSIRLRYAVDLGFLGDALLVSHCHFSSFGHPTIFMSECGGGEISDNILNGDVRIAGSKGIVFSSNHMETGAQVKVIGSVVEISNNYFEKDSVPSVVVTKGGDDHAVVSLKNNVYAAINRDRTTSEDKLVKERRLNRLCPIDVDIDDSTILDIENEYRYDIVVGFGAVRPFGINISINGENFKEFNEKSYAYSVKSHIVPHRGIQGTMMLNKLGKKYLNHIQTVDWVNWFGADGCYQYSYQYVPDASRGIYESKDGLITHKVDNGKIMRLKKSGDGMLLSLGTSGTPMNCCVRLFRTCVKSESDHSPLKIETVDVPIVGGIMLYDNGISICGYKWREIDSIPEPTSKVVYKALRIDGTNVSAWGESCPETSKGGWRVGDMIYNVGNSTDWQTKIVK